MANSEPVLSVEYISGAAVATLNVEKILEDSVILAIENTLMPLIEENEKIKMVIDFRNVQFLSSAMLGLLIRVNHRISKAQGKLALSAINAKIMGIFKITRLDQVFQIYQESSAAIDSMTSEVQA